ncbi:MAG: NAD-dependent dehydratase, partial [Ferruginibacter sp.]
LKQLPADVAITFMRPVGFYYNLLDFIDIIKGQGFLKGFVGKIMALRFYGLTGLLQGKNGLIISNYGAEDKMPWVSPKDIASAIAEELAMNTTGIKIRYVASDELTCNQVASIIGEAIGKPYLKWGTISDKQMMGGLKQFKVPFDIASDITEMNASMRSGGILFNDYYKNKPALGKVKLKDFAKEFAVVYNQK